MKKIFTVLVMALAVSLAFTGCASKKANAKGPKIYRVDIGYAIGGTIEVGEVAQEINISALLPEDKLPVAGDTVRVMWTLVADADINNLYVSLGADSEGYVLAEELEANQANYVVVNIPVKEDLTGSVYLSLWSDSEAVCETTYIDAK